mmetsp:Transcript_10441/g.11928  ORF Transcript_10441/g.11928 Transcript_10441/m.11928 type:complete len:103 (-) Transcript_10441:241-549(-)
MTHLYLLALVYFLLVFVGHSIFNARVQLLVCWTADVIVLLFALTEVGLYIFASLSLIVLAVCLDRICNFLVGNGKKNRLIIHPTSLKAITGEADLQLAAYVV